MSNPNAPFGFKPVRSASGGAHVSVSTYALSSASARIGKGDLVVLVNDGGIKKETSATAVGPWVGVSMCDSGTVVAGTAHPVCDDQTAILEVQGPSSTLALTDMNRILKVNGSATANTSTGLSGAKLTNTDATASNGVRAIRLANRPNNAFGAYQVLEVSFNSRSSGQAGV